MVAARMSTALRGHEGGGGWGNGVGGGGFSGPAGPFSGAYQSAAAAAASQPISAALQPSLAPQFNPRTSYTALFGQPAPHVLTHPGMGSSSMPATDDDRSGIALAAATGAVGLLSPEPGGGGGASLFLPRGASPRMMAGGGGGGGYTGPYVGGAASTGSGMAAEVLQRSMASFSNSLGHGGGLPSMSQMGLPAYGSAADPAVPKNPFMGGRALPSNSIPGGVDGDDQSLKWVGKARPLTAAPGPREIAMAGYVAANAENAATQFGYQVAAATAPDGEIDGRWAGGPLASSAYPRSPPPQQRYPQQHQQQHQQQHEQQQEQLLPQPPAFVPPSSRASTARGDTGAAALFPPAPAAPAPPPPLPTRRW